jgi:hypothetical protein
MSGASQSPSSVRPARIAVKQGTSQKVCILFSEQAGADHFVGVQGRDHRQRDMAKRKYQRPSADAKEPVARAKGLSRTR